MSEISVKNEKSTSKMIVNYIHNYIDLIPDVKTTNETNRVDEKLVKNKEKTE